MRGGSCENHSPAALSNAIMWLVLTRAPLPDAPYWPGRRLLALVDAVGWPVAWIAVAMQLPQPAGIGSLVISVPNVPALAGITIYTQALLQQLPGQLRLTNVVGDVILR